MDETYGTYVVDECFDVHDYDEDTDDDAGDDTDDGTNDDANDGTDDGGRGHLYIHQESMIKDQGARLKDQGSRSRIKYIVRPCMSILEEQQT